MKENEYEKRRWKAASLLIESEEKFSISQEFSVNQMQVEGSVVEQLSHLFSFHLGI